MNWAQYKDPVSQMCHVGAVVASWPHTQEVADWVRTLIFVTEFSKLGENIWGKLNYFLGESKDGAIGCSFRQDLVK